VVAATTIAASGSRWKAVVAAAIVGSTFPLAGLLAFAAGDKLSSPLVTAITFALTAGILIFVCMTELLPKVYLEDTSPHKRVATNSIFAGMVIMGIVMVLLTEFGAHMH
jgi:ZIP family zinc transporter